MTSLKKRLDWGLGIGLFVLLGGVFAGVAVSLHLLVENQMISRMEKDAETVLAAVTVFPEGFQVDQARVDPVFLRPFSGHYFVVTGNAGTAKDGDQRIRSRSLWDEDIATLHSFPADHFYVDGPRGQPLLLIQRGYTKSGVQLTVSVAEDLTDVNAANRKALLVLAGLFAVALLLVLLIQRFIIARTLMPLDDVRRDVAALEEGRVERLRETVPKEVRPLVAEVNRLLAAMTRRVERSRKSLGNLAHAVKTPLTVLTQLSDREELEKCPEMRDALTTQTDTIGRLVERELGRARLAGTALPGAQVDLHDALPGLIDALEKVYADKNLDIATELPGGATFPGDREDLMELLGNLLDNACKWANKRVRLTVDDRDGLTFIVEDDGPGCPEEELPKLSERGVRADENVPGHGLGLAIAKDVVESYGGRIEFGRSEELGGFQVTVSVPA